MNAIRNGLLAGFLATLAVTVLMMVKTASGQFPELHVIRTLSSIIGMPGNVIVAFGIHIFIGTVVWGVAFAFVAPLLPGNSYLMKGLIFGILAWLAMMTIFMPLAEAGFFAVHRGTMTVPFITFIYHLVFGIVLGTVYSWNMPVTKYAKNEASRNS